MSRIVSWLKFSKNIIRIEPYFFLDKVFWNENMGWTVFSFVQNFQWSNIGWTELRFGHNFLKRLDESNRIAFWSKFCEKTIWVEQYCFLVKIFLKYYMNWTYIVFWSKCSSKTIWVEPYTILLNIFSYCLLFKTFSKAYTAWTVLSFDQNFLKGQYGFNLLCIGNNFLKYELNRIVFRQNFPKTLYGLNHIIFGSIPQNFSKRL